ncbi:MAG TPA: FtsK/SpoIIIE domain-containing protein [Dactylosporangium sp.]|jgi:S-DNA-T family DNA segregation ATPase FtsK/SpoIIIE|nr:FtsK/SpoIIIE domain-containing protein [Dactylosporangium sp.]
MPPRSPLDDRLLAATTTVRGQDQAARVEGGAALWGIADAAAFDPVATWRAAAGRPAVSVAIGTSAGGEPVTLDLRRESEGGGGAHLYVSGATGSGKTELLRTLAVGLAAAYPPEELNLLFVDLMGGSAYQGLTALPHSAGFATQLDYPTGTRELGEAIADEVYRCQELLRGGGHGPRLVILCDDLSALVAYDPGFVEVLVLLGRVGGSLGMHLVLADQRFEPQRLRGLATYLSQRVALRTYSAAQSRELVGVPDAYELPNAPGHALLRVGEAAPRPFRAAYLPGPGELDVLVGRIAPHGRRARQLWPRG